jgi:hypothetical protein
MAWAACFDMGSSADDQEPPDITHRLKVINADLLRSVQVPVRLRKDRWHMAGCALGFVVEENFALFRSGAIKGSFK